MSHKKTGIDYYAHNVGMTADRRLRALRREFGSVGIDVWFSLLDMIYSDKGYYMEYSDITRRDVIMDLQDAVAGKDVTPAEVVEGILTRLVQMELLDSDLFMEGILTSREIQKQYYNSTLRRKHVAVEKSLWLLSVEEMKAENEKSPILDYLLNGQNVNANSKNVDILPQSKVKQSKAEESKAEENESKAEESKAEESKAEESRAEESKAEPSVSDETELPELPALPAAVADRISAIVAAAEAAARSAKEYAYAHNNGRNIGEQSVTEETPAITQEAPRTQGTESVEKPFSSAGAGDEDGSIRAELVLLYGEERVRQYERRFYEWSRKTNPKRARKYPLLKKWMSDDGVAAPSAAPSYPAGTAADSPFAVDNAMHSAPTMADFAERMRRQYGGD